MIVPLLAEVTARAWLTACAIALSTILIAIIVRRLTKRRIRKVDTHAELIDAGGRLAIAVIVSLGAFYTLRALDVEIGPLVGALGVGALFIAVGLQPLLVNVVGSVILQARRPFRRGDQILAAGFEGTVVDITSTSTVLLSYNGEAVHVPNAALLASPMVNWTHEPIRRSITTITLPYDCHLPRTLRLLGASAREALADDNLPPAEALASGFGPDGIEAELRYWHYSDELEARVAQSQVVVAAARALADAGIAIPYPQRVVHRSAADRAAAESNEPDTTGPNHAEAT